MDNEIQEFNNKYLGMFLVDFNEFSELQLLFPH